MKNYFCKTFNKKIKNKKNSVIHIFVFPACPASSALPRITRLKSVMRRTAGGLIGRNSRSVTRHLPSNSVLSDIIGLWCNTHLSRKEEICIRSNCLQLMNSSLTRFKSTSSQHAHYAKIAPECIAKHMIKINRNPLGYIRRAKFRG